uniref:Uncharacterized protein n=1 Tax=Anguilla anguilla TaxID=7936 RepID=A0A0E9QLR4_ANGAN
MWNCSLRLMQMEYFSLAPGFVVLWSAINLFVSTCVGRHNRGCVNRKIWRWASSVPNVFSFKQTRFYLKHWHLVSFWWTYCMVPHIRLHQQKTQKQEIKLN